MSRLLIAMWLPFIALTARSAGAQTSLDHSERGQISVSAGVGTLLHVDRRTADRDRSQPTAGLGLWDYDTRGMAHEGSLTIGVGYLHPLLRYAALGAELQYMTWEPRDDYDLGYPRYDAFDLSIVPRAQLPLGPGVMLFAAVPFGASLNFIDADVERQGFHEQASTGTGFNFGLRAGITAALTRYFGVVPELALSWHWLHHTWTYSATDGQPFVHDQEAVSYATTTLFLRLGGYYALP